MTWRLIIQNLLYKPLSTLLSAVLLMLGTGIISLLLLMQTQMARKFKNDLKDIDMVVGAKGSPLQLVLSAVYHIDAPAGNIKKSEAEMLNGNVMIEQIIPLAYGDNYHTFRIVGTTEDYLKKYNAVFSSGRIFHKPFEAVAGAHAAKQTALTTGSSFTSTHGLASEGGEEHAAHSYTITGILKPTNTVLDNLIITDIETVWAVHEESHEEEDEHIENKKGYTPNNETDSNVVVKHPPAHHTNEDGVSDELTALLIKFRSPMGIISIPRFINENTNMQAAVPSLEVNRLLSLLGIGTDTLGLIAKTIMVVSGLSIFISLYTRLDERRYELALMRSWGCSPIRLFFITVTEGIMIALGGYLGGIFLSRFGIKLINNYAEDTFHIQFKLESISNGEWILLSVTIGIGVLAALLPALKVFYINISKTLSDE